MLITFLNYLEFFLILLQFNSHSIRTNWVIFWPRCIKLSSAQTFCFQGQVYIDVELKTIYLDSACSGDHFGTIIIANKSKS